MLLVFGLGQILIAFWFLATLAASLEMVILVALVLFAASGVLFVFAGARDSIEFGSRTLAWSQVDSLGMLLLAGAWMLGSVPVARDRPLFGVVVAAGGLALAFLGYQGFVDGEHVNSAARS
jgi:hypothetical protein